MKLQQAFEKGSFNLLLRAAFRNNTIRHSALPFIERKMRKAFEAIAVKEDRPILVEHDKYALVDALLRTVSKRMDQGLVSGSALNRMFDTLLDNVVLNKQHHSATERLGFKPPLFLLISPGMRCNLHCTGCYACSDSKGAAKLDWDTFDRLIREKEQLWGSYFTVISGGEPFMWEDNDLGLLDMIRRHPTEYFLIYTNSTLVTKSVARELAHMGNATLAISVEGYEAQTDLRRGKGVHRKILQAMENLRQAQVPFGISVTATRDNVDLVTSNEFIDYYFDQQGATFGWLFQYMPIGRGHTLDMMLTPQQRLEAFDRVWRIVRERKVFYADFWNSGTAANGCICAGRPGGYMYINWDGAVAPCAFVPYSTHNINDVFRSGGNLDTVLLCPFFEKIRQWQDEYGYAKPAGKTGNWLCPCIIRDHFDVFLDTARQTAAAPIDSEAAAALTDPQYHKGMIRYGKDYDALTRDVWNSRYLAPEKDLAKVERAAS